MILAIDVGNTNIVIGAFEQDSLRRLFFERFQTNIHSTSLEYASIFKTTFEIHRIDRHQIEGCILSSVVPSVNATLCEAVKKYTGADTIIVSPGIKTGIRIQVDNPATMGADLIVGAVAGAAEYPVPQILIDMGTATTVSVIDRDKVFIGKMILPGVRISLDALVGRTAQLPTISLKEPKHLVGKTTVESIQGGILYGNAGALDGIIDRINEEMQAECTCIATGGLAGVVTPLCRHKIIIDDDLLLKGLMLLYERNRSL